MLSDLFRRKPLGQVHQDSELHRSLSGFDLTLMGIGVIIGAGIFVLTGIAAATKAGPAIILSYTISGIAALFAALAYAELAASIGGTGSAYHYAYTGIGEFFAWLLGWNLLLEYMMSVATVAIGWSGYVNNLFEAMQINLPIALTKNPFQGGNINLLAVLAIIGIAFLLSMNVKRGAHFTAIIVLIKLITLATFVAVSFSHVNVNNWHPFMPFGLAGVMEGAALVFFAYIGFDALSTAVEETINPQRNVPVGIIASLIVCTLIYILVSALLTGIVPYTALNVRSPVAEALLLIGHHTAAGLVAAGAIAGLTTVMFVMYFGLTRIILAIARDGLLPSSITKIDKTSRTPLRIIWLTGIFIALVSGFTPIDRAAELVNIGTLAAFTFVCIGVIIFRITHPDLLRPFKLPFNPYTPLIGVLFCVTLMLHLSAVTWWRFFLWSILGIIIYFAYSQKHSKLRNASGKQN